MAAVLDSLSCGVVSDTVAPVSVVSESVAPHLFGSDLVAPDLVGSDSIAKVSQKPLWVFSDKLALPETLDL